jgi:ribosomal protein L16 Arg81 hydroxylase
VASPTAATTRAGILGRLLAPVGVDGFIREYFGKAPLLLRGAADRVDGLLTIDRVADAVVRRTAERGRFLVNAGDLDSADGVAAYLAAGQPIVWNGARGVTQALDALTSELGETFGASVWANVYSTGAAAKPFDIHFDAHDVLAVQCEGAKEWLVSKVRINCPLDVPALAPTIRRALDERRDEAFAEPLMTVRALPGDVLYIPRGQFHDARTPEGRSLHITFAIAPPTGLDVLDAIASLAIREALFRDYLPHPLADGDGARTRAHLARLAERLSELARSEDVLARVRRNRVRDDH